jgi:uncharacterized protein YecT (DUF1311 family)
MAKKPKVEDRVSTIEKTLVACTKKSGGVTAAMRSCLSDASQAMDAQLNVVYRRLMAKLDKPNAELLRDAQRNWLAFRQAETTFARAAGPDQGATLGLIVLDDLNYTMLKDRTKALQGYLSYLEL